jgi:hypothetical protein
MIISRFAGRYQRGDCSGKHQPSNEAKLLHAVPRLEPRRGGTAI